MDAIQILSTADLHLGRRPSQVPVDVNRCSTVDGWHQVVEAARRRDVDVVMLVGDIVDQNNKFYEAFGPLQRGIDRLADRGIWTVAVGGNHDHDVSSRLARVVDSDRWCLLGEGGRWEKRRLTWEDGRALDLFGWSFPDEHVDASPLTDFPDGRVSGDIPTVALMHGEYDTVDSLYAPVSRGEVEATGVRTWVMGHRHQPAIHDFSRGEVIYPGTPQPLDPGETGVHGATLLKVPLSSDERASAEQLDLSTLAYHLTEIDVEAIDTRDEFEELVVRQIERAHRALVDERRQLEWIVHRVVLTGRTAVQRHLNDWGRRFAAEFSLHYESVGGNIDSVRIDTTPDFDLRSLARADDPPGVLAEVLLEVGLAEDDHVTRAPADLPEDVDALIRELRDLLQRDIYGSNAYAPLRADSKTADPPKRDDVVQMLQEVGFELLEALMSQRTAGVKRRSIDDMSTGEAGHSGGTSW